MNKKKINTVPKYRFPEFGTKNKWEMKKLDDLAQRITKRNQGSSIKRVLTNSAVDGVVDQSDFFDKEVADRNNLDNYFVIDEGDYVYNPRISSTAPVGPISKNKVGKGVMSPLYTVFRFESKNNDFYEQYFKTSFWHQYIKSISNTGARHDRISISSDNFMKMPLPYSSNEERHKIAACLSSLDDLIIAEDKKLEALKMHKKGLMQKLFPAEGKALPEWRFPEFKDSGKWDYVKVAAIRSGKLTNGVFNNPKNVGTGYKLINVSDMYLDTLIDDNNLSLIELSEREFLKNKVEHGDLFFTRSSLVKEGIACCNIYMGDSNDVTFDGHLIRFRPNKNLINPLFSYYLFKINSVRNQLIVGGKTATMTTIGQSDIDITIVPLPQIPEQEKISDCLSSIDCLMATQTNMIEALKAHKKGLLQGLFPSIEEVRE